MAFTPVNFKCISGTNSKGGRLWMYREAATLGAIDEDGYFNGALTFGLLDQDIILALGSDGFGFFETTVSAGVVTVAANESIESS